MDLYGELIMIMTESHWFHTNNNLKTPIGRLRAAATNAFFIENCQHHNRIGKLL